MTEVGRAVRQVAARPVGWAAFVGAALVVSAVFAVVPAWFDQSASMSGANSGLHALNGTLNGTSNGTAGSSPPCASSTASGSGWVNITNPNCGPSDRRSAGYAYDPAAGYILMFGGYEATYGWYYYQDTWEYSHGNWTELSPTQSPPAMGAQAMAYDPNLHAVLLFGGVAYGESFNQTWAFSNGNWTEINTTSAPSARFSPAMAFDENSGDMILYGGDYAPSLNVDVGLGDTWEFNGLNWVQLNPTVSPPARFPGEMAWDPADESIVLFGGWNTTGGANPSFYYNDTWEFSAGNWKQVTTSTAPSARTLTALATVPGGVLLFGGSDATTVFNDTWFFAGGNWTQLSVGAVPGDRTGAMLAYDAADQAAILFGGVNHGVWLADTFSLASGSIPVHSGPGAPGGSLIGEPQPWKTLFFSRLLGQLRIE